MAVTEIKNINKNNGKISSIYNWYFKPKSFEKSGKIYENLGVKKFKNLLLKINKRPHYRLGENKSFENYERKIRYFETVHLISGLAFFGIVVPPLIKAVNSEKNILPVLLSGAIVGGANLVINGYAVMLQRYNRVRLNHIIEKKKKLNQKLEDIK